LWYGSDQVYIQFFDIAGGVGDTVQHMGHCRDWVVLEDSCDGDDVVYHYSHIDMVVGIH
jgi:hypothetical protein